jgi:hypothetical protein
MVGSVNPVMPIAAIVARSGRMRARSAAGSASKSSALAT